MIDHQTHERLTMLRAPFPDDAVNLKPVYIGDYVYDEYRNAEIPESAWGKCSICGRHHPLPSKHLRYVGHARITERLNDIDPEWDWKPLATGDNGLPLVWSSCLWIELTVCGITKKGVGDAGGKTGTDAMKEMVGDAIRNAAMRFGCGLEMWFAQDGDTEPPHPASGSEGSKPEFVAIVRHGATKAQTSIACELTNISNAGLDATEASQAISDEFGRPYYELNQKEVNAALELLSEMYPTIEEPEECEVIKV